MRKIRINKKKYSPIAGIKLVQNQLDKVGFNKLVDDHFGGRRYNTKYSNADILQYHFHCTALGHHRFQNADRNVRDKLNGLPGIKAPSRDTIRRFYQRISLPTETVIHNSTRNARKASENQINNNPILEGLNSKLIKSFQMIGPGEEVTLDADATIIYSKKRDHKATYDGPQGLQPMVALVDKTVVCVSTRNGNTSPAFGYDNIVKRSQTILLDAGVKIKRFRADAAADSYTLMDSLHEQGILFYIRKSTARISKKVKDELSAMNLREGVSEAANGMTFRAYYGSTSYKGVWANNEYRIVVKKTEQDDLTHDRDTEFHYWITNDWDMTEEEVIRFYGKRMAVERDFDFLKNDAGWRILPFHSIDHNASYLFLKAICHNVATKLIEMFSEHVEGLSPHNRLQWFRDLVLRITFQWNKRCLIISDQDAQKIDFEKLMA